MRTRPSRTTHAWARRWPFSSLSTPMRSSVSTPRRQSKYCSASACVRQGRLPRILPPMAFTAQAMRLISCSLAAPAGNRPLSAGGSRFRVVRRCYFQEALPQSPSPLGKVPRKRRKGEPAVCTPPQYHRHDLRPSLRDSSPGRGSRFLRAEWTARGSAS